MIKKFCVLSLSVFIISALSKADQPLEGNASGSDINNKIGVVEKLGGKIPLNISFLDSGGKKVTLAELINKPSVIEFAYYKCTGICTPLMTEIADVINKVDLTPGKDYNIITISIDENEFPKDASAKKAEIMNLVKTEISPDAWSFLTGDSASIYTVAKASGFNFQRQDETFLHTGVLIFVSSNGKICRYLRPGYSNRGEFRILPFEFKMAILESSKGQVIPVVNEALQYCFSYQPQSHSYVFNWFKISGVSVLVIVAALFVFVVIKPRKKTSNTNKTNSNRDYKNKL